MGAQGVINAPDTKWGQAFLFVTSGATGTTITDNVPFGQLQEITLSDDFSLKELQGNGQLTSISVGIADRKYTGTAKNAAVRANQLLAMRGATLASLVAVTPPAGVPTLSSVVSAGATLLGQYYGVAYTYLGPNGESTPSPVGTVLNTVSQGILTGIIVLPANVSSLNFYITAACATALIAATAPLQLVAGGQSGAAYTITTPAVAAAPSAPITSPMNTARTVINSYTTDEPLPFHMHLKNPGDGSQVEMRIFNCIAPKLSWSIKLREWVIPDFSWQAYGDPISGLLAQTILPNNQVLF